MNRIFPFRIHRFRDKHPLEKKIIQVINFSRLQLQVFSGAKEAMKRKLWHPHLSAVQVIYLPWQPVFGPCSCQISSFEILFLVANISTPRHVRNAEARGRKRLYFGSYLNKYTTTNFFLIYKIFYAIFKKYLFTFFYLLFFMLFILF